MRLLVVMRIVPPLAVIGQDLKETVPPLAVIGQDLKETADWLLTAPAMVPVHRPQNEAAFQSLKSNSTGSSVRLAWQEIVRPAMCGVIALCGIVRHTWFFGGGSSGHVSPPYPCCRRVQSTDCSGATQSSAQDH